MSTAQIDFVPIDSTQPQARGPPSPVLLARHEVPVVQFFTADLAYPPIPLRVLPEHSSLGQLALANMRANYAALNLSNAFSGLDQTALRTVLDTLFARCLNSAKRPSAPRPVLVKLKLMCAMYTVCEVLGLDFEQLVRPHFCTLDTLEWCRFATTRPGARGSITFSDNHVQIDYRAVDNQVKISGRFGFTLESYNTLRLVGDDSNVQLRVDQAGHRVLLEIDGVQLSEPFVNQTPQFQCAAAPAVPHYARQAD